ncbi:MAG TPA: hypothetical protein PKH19_02140, partial [Candidatus Syntrophosphaera sp.]|nr:hypothetical protein [Candidatus Syntrophosphaera sp.]
SIAQDGTLSWPAVPGAQIYNIYAANSPTGYFTSIASTTALSWLDYGFNLHQRRFYQVRASTSP